MNTELLQKYISGNATEAEKQHVTKWMQESPENMREYMAQRKLYDIALWRTAPIAEEKRQQEDILIAHTMDRSSKNRSNICSHSTGYTLLVRKTFYRAK